jgi:hypothetical protein
MAEKELVCKDCGTTFLFTEGEQAFYKEKGFENEPQRCPECRRAKKLKIIAAAEILEDKIAAQRSLKHQWPSLCL